MQVGPIFLFDRPLSGDSELGAFSNGPIESVVRLVVP
jgi:hypothetical protein